LVVVDTKNMVYKRQLAATIPFYPRNNVVMSLIFCTVTSLICGIEMGVTVFDKVPYQLFVSSFPRGIRTPSVVVSSSGVRPYKMQHGGYTAIPNCVIKQSVYVYCWDCFEEGDGVCIIIYETLFEIFAINGETSFENNSITWTKHAIVL
jgi:hypothetical protein